LLAIDVFLQELTMGLKFGLFLANNRGNNLLTNNNWEAAVLSVANAIKGGQSEPTATNAPIGRSVHWMPCIFSFGARWGS
jgi:hypothetical protein